MSPAENDGRSAWRARFDRLPEKVRLLLVALVGALIGLATYQLIYWINPFEAITKIYRMD